MGSYDDILVPTSGQPVSVSQFGVPVRDAIQDLDVRLADAADPDITTTAGDVGTVASGFTVNDVRAATLFGGKLVHVDLYLVLSGSTITATNGNITDTPCFTLATAYRPSGTVSTIWSSGLEDGECVITTGGGVTLRTASHTIDSGVNIRISAMFIKD